MRYRRFSNKLVLIVKKNEITDKLYSKEDILDFCTNLVFGFDSNSSKLDISRRFDGWEKIFKKNKFEGNVREG